MRRLVWLLLMPVIAALIVVTKAAWVVSAGLLWVLTDLEAWASRKE